ncbi:MAG: IS1595 family transposase [Anaerolineae bacterium]
MGLLTDLIYIILTLAALVTPARGGHRTDGEVCRLLSLSWRAAAPESLTRLVPALIRWEVWDTRQVPRRRHRQRHNPQRNRERRLRRLARQRRRRPLPPRQQRRRRAARVRLLLNPPCPAPWSGGSRRIGNVPPPPPASPSGVSTGQEPPPDPLAHLRQHRGWIDLMAEAELWDLLRQVRWPHRVVVCPDCGETDPQYVTVIDRHYRGGLYRYGCRVCAGAGDPGEGGTFTDLTGTPFDGMRIDIRSLWRIVELFVEGQAAVETADEVRVHRHTTQRYFRLLRGAIYLARPTEPIALGPEDIVEEDEVYITAGWKGQAGGHKLERDPRRRGLKRRGRGTWDSDRLPVFGLLCRGGQVRLFVLRNVQTDTIRPIVHQMVRQGAHVYTDGYCIYHFLSREGYQHATVNHSAGEYARGDIHCNTMEATWSWLRQMIRTYRGVSKVYLPLYVAQFEFFYNRRHENRWNRMLDVLQVAFQADAATLLAHIDGAQFAEICPVAG